MTIDKRKAGKKMKNLIKLEIELSPTEATTLCSILAKGICYYTDAEYAGTETVNPMWLWGIMHDLSKAMYEQNTKEEN